MRIKENAVVLEDIDNIIENVRIDWGFFEGQGIFITGGLGLLGSYLVGFLLRANDSLSLNLTITVLSRTSPNSKSRLYPWINHPKLNLVKGTTETYDYSRLSTHSIVVHAASQASPKSYTTDPVGTLLPNCLGIIRLCEQAVKWKSKKLLFFSSGEIYGSASNVPLLEKDFGLVDPADIRSCYAESKRMGETICKAYSSQFGLCTTSARIFHTYGPQMALDDGRVFADFVRDSLNGNSVCIASSGTDRRCCCYIADATEAFLHLIALGMPGESYNMANPDAETTILDLAHLAASLSKFEISVEFANCALAKPGYVASGNQRPLPSIDKIRELGWSPRTDLRKGFERTMRSYLS
jgi:UDP-glucuronate decarboxylase